MERSNPDASVETLQRNRKFPYKHVLRFDLDESVEKKTQLFVIKTSLITNTVFTIQGRRSGITSGGA